LLAHPHLEAVVPVAFRGGKLHAQPARPHLKLAHYLTPGAVLPAAPASADWLSRVTDWPMYLNDRVGDCTCAAVGHMIEAFTAYAQGAPVELTDQDVLWTYEAVTGYDPRDPSTDRGAYVQDVLAYWQATGVAGHRILAYAAVDVANLDEVRLAVDLFGAVDVGLQFPSSAMDQFNAGQPWDVVDGATVSGGHCVPVGAYAADGSLTCVTWGRPQVMTEAFWRAYVDEAWIVITPDWVDARGTDPQGLSLYQLGADFAALTGKPNPIPAPTPPPSPRPGPHHGHHHLRLADEIRRWLEEMGL
jgi:hypothetical protein